MVLCGGGGGGGGGVVQETPPEIIPKLENMIGNYALSVVPQSLFDVDGSPLLPHDKASITHAVEAAKPYSLTDVVSQKSSDAIDSLKPAPKSLNWTPEQPDHVLNIDAMTVAHSKKKAPGMTTIQCKNWKDVEWICGGQNNLWSIDGSLQEKTRSKRAIPDTVWECWPWCTWYHAHQHHPNEETAVMHINEGQLFWSFRTWPLGIFWWEGCPGRCCVWHNCQEYQPRRLTEDHSHEEADTLISLHVILSIQGCTCLTQTSLFCRLLMDMSPDSI